MAVVTLASNGATDDAVPLLKPNNHTHLAKEVLGAYPIERIEYHRTNNRCSSSNHHKSWCVKCSASCCSSAWSWKRIGCTLLTLPVLVGFVGLAWLGYGGGEGALGGATKIRYWNYDRGTAENFAAQALAQNSGRFKSKSFTQANLSWKQIWMDPTGASRFNFNGNDVLVFLHIQKTAGTTFEKWLVRNLDVEHPCECSRGRKRCRCVKPPGGPHKGSVMRDDDGDPTGWEVGGRNLAAFGGEDWGKAAGLQRRAKRGSVDGSTFADAVDKQNVASLVGDSVPVDHHYNVVPVSKNRGSNSELISDQIPPDSWSRSRHAKGGEEDQLWLFSRYSTGWSCGLHADWTEMVVSNCVDNVLDKRERQPRKRRYFYTTFLRDPVSRYISEFRHIQRGATWRGALHICDGRPPTPDELPSCYDMDAGWQDVSLAEFLDCPYNLANNRQTRMLADLTLIGCYNSSSVGMTPLERDGVMLASAKHNLASMAFFGLQEYLHESQFIFEEAFDLRFTVPMVNVNYSKSSGTPVTEQQMEQIRKANSLDLKLYDFARDLFLKRFEQVKAGDADFVDRFGVEGDSGS